MGNRGFNAGGFAYMPRVKCRHCGRKFPIGTHSRDRTCARCTREGKRTVFVSEEEHRAEVNAYWIQRGKPRRASR